MGLLQCADDCPSLEEATTEQEAQNIANHYAYIIAKIKEQL